MSKFVINFILWFPLFFASRAVIAFFDLIIAFLYNVFNDEIVVSDTKKSPENTLLNAIFGDVFDADMVINMLNSIPQCCCCIRKLSRCIFLCCYLLATRSRWCPWFIHLYNLTNISMKYEAKQLFADYTLLYLIKFSSRSCFLINDLICATLKQSGT